MADGGDMRFTYGLLVVAIIFLIGMPYCINVFAPAQTVNPYADQLEQLNADYKDFTGSSPVKEDIWTLEGIYKPYTQNGPYGYTSDGWLHGGEVHSYTPTQYSSGPTAYTVENTKIVDGEVRDLPYYQYTSIGQAYTGIEEGDVYTSVALDVNQKSDIFFTPNNKTELVNGSFFFDYSGYRYAFKPLVDIVGLDINNDPLMYSANTSTCSIVWYQFYNISSGLSGQLIVQYGDDRGTAYITTETILSSFTSQNNTSKLALQFNGVKLNLYVRMDSYYMASGLSLEECFNSGYYSIMITSDSVDSSAYMATDYKFNPEGIFNTMIDLLTFNTEDYGFSGIVAYLYNMVVIVTFYAGLLVVGMNNYKVLIVAGILTAIEAIVAFIQAGGGGLFG